MDVLGVAVGKRIYGLDILRCLAILFVVVGHGNYLLPEKYANYVRPIVMDGVSIFFVLSGFLIGGILIRVLEKDGASFHSLWNFWSRRWFRTLPNYFLILTILTLLNLLFTEGFALRSIKRYFFFAQNLFTEHGDFFPEAWSLCVEEWFYLLVPLCIFIMSGSLKVNYRKAILTTAFLIIAAVTTYRLYKFSNFPVDSVSAWDLNFRKQVSTRLDSLMFGVIGAYTAYFYQPAWFKFKNILFVLGICLAIMFQISMIFNRSVVFGQYLCVYSFTLSSLSTLCLLPFLSSIKSGTGRVYRLITTISFISYSMYLINLSIVQYWILENLPLSGKVGLVARYALYWFLTVSLSMALFRYYEMPMTRIRERFTKKEH